jgi:PAS domain S-box-containing protein
MEGEMGANIDKRTHELQHALAYAENIIATLREPFVVLDKGLRVRSANAAFYRDFHASKEETEGRLLYELGDGRWDIPQLRTLLPQVLSDGHAAEDFEVEHALPAIGRRNLLLNARRFPPEGDDPDLVLLAIEDITDRRKAEAAMRDSEVRYRRLFQTAQDGILILDADTGKVIDANPFMTALLGYSHEEFLGKELWEIGLFRDIRESRAAYRDLQEKGYVRYENLPLESTRGKKVEVEFVSNVYAENRRQVVQCNVRDITERSRLQRLAQERAAAS